MKPFLREISDHFVLHVETNNLDLERQPELIVKSISDVAAALKSEKRNVRISNIIVRNDSLKTKASEVKRQLRKMCHERNFSLIDHTKNLKAAEPKRKQITPG